MKVSLNIEGNWGLGDLLNLDAALTRFKRQNPQVTGFTAAGKLGILEFRPDVVREAKRPESHFDYQILGYKQLGSKAYQKLEALSSLRDHMSWYLGMDPVTNELPSLYLDESIKKKAQEIRGELSLNASDHNIFLCVDGRDPRRHPSKKWWLKVIEAIRRSCSKGTKIILVGHEDLKNPWEKIIHRALRNSADFDLRGLDLRLTSAIINPEDTHVGPNSGCFQYFQTRNCHHIIVFSMNKPDRYIFQKEVWKIKKIQKQEMPCINCCNRSFEYIEKHKCVAKKFGECISEISPRVIADAFNQLIKL